MSIQHNKKTELPGKHAPSCKGMGRADQPPSCIAWTYVPLLIIIMVQRSQMSTANCES